MVRGVTFPPTPLETNGRKKGDQKREKKKRKEELI